ncbi:hypothetical protein BRADI_1g18822v3 [Brachypodium distachyon]|uniref:Uncharacterized protein n=1 Tax=Brachypodium distachyon TaxID=15368 RepID=A0A0Q3JS05_BRADI|nr:hypothetical protein BRADI_1g18822v3 [Brachypodium distachyon]
MGDVGTDGLAELPRRLPHALPFLGPHRPLDGVPDTCGRRDLPAPLPWAHEDPGAEVPAHELRVPRLVAVHRPRQDGLPVAQALHRRVPPAMAHERRRCPVRQDLQLRRPPRHHHALLSRRDSHVGAGRGGAGRAHVGAVGVPERPQEPLAALAQGLGELRELFAAEGGRRAEGDVQHGGPRLLVEPPQALVPLEGLWSRLPRVRGEEWVQGPDGEQLASIGGGREKGEEDIEELPLESAAGVDDHAGAGRAAALLAHAAGERDELRRGAGVGAVERHAVLAEEGVAGIRPPDVVGRGEAVHAERLAVGQLDRLGGRERRHPVVEHDDAAVRGGQLGQERGERSAGAGAEGLEERLHVRRERGRRSGVRVRARVRRDGEGAEADGGEVVVVAPAVEARAGLAEVRLRRGEVDGDPARGEEEGEVEELVQVALRRERDRHDRDRRRFRRHPGGRFRSEGGGGGSEILF